MSERKALVHEAREFMRGSPFGVLSTISVTLPGYPFGSVAPFSLDYQGQPVILISDLAQHTHNIKRDPRVSLLVMDAVVDDPHPEARLTWIGNAQPLAGTDEAVCRRYLRRHTEAAAYFESHDFAFYAISCLRVRYIGGFGRITWIEPEEILQDNPFALSEADILDHMNTDHQQALHVYCQAFKGIMKPQQASMVAIDAAGFEVLADGKLLRFSFAAPIATPDDARQVLIDMVKRARAAIS